MQTEAVTPEPATKPMFSKDGKKQLCVRCNRYCRRTLNMCPTCYPR